MQHRDDSKEKEFSPSPMVKILPSSTEGVGSSPSQGTKIPHVSLPKK